MNQNNLNTYSDNNEFFDNFKGIIKIAIILFLLILIALIVTSVFFIDVKTFSLDISNVVVTAKSGR